MISVADLVLEVDHLRKSYPGRGTEVVAVDDLSFTLGRGRSLAIVGESGSGKTTVARCLLGLERPSAGRVSVCRRERELGRVSLRERRQRAKEIQMVFQDPYGSLNPRDSIGTTLRRAIALRDDRPIRSVEIGEVTELLSAVELAAGRVDALPRDLSGGQRQRVAIARAIASGAEVLVLDEAVAALDVSVQAQVLNVLDDLRRSAGVSYLFISHDLAVVRQVCDDVMVMERGRIVEQGPADDVLSAPSHSYTRRLLDAVPRPGWRPGIPTSPLSVEPADLQEEITS